MENLELPKGWMETTLEEVANLIYGKGLSTSDLKPSGFPVYGANGVIGFFDKYLYQEPKLIISCRGAASGVTHITQPNSFVTSNSIVLDVPNDLLKISFLDYFLTLSNKQDIITGTAQPQITINNLKDFRIKLAPLAEQKRIVAEIETVLTWVSEAQEELDKIPAFLRAFRQKVLAMAVSGELTKDFRENTEGGATGWKNCFLEYGFEKGNIFDGPFGSNLKTADYVESGVQVIRLENIGFMTFNEDKKTYVSEKKYESLKRHEVFEGDIIFSSFITENTRTTILPRLEGKAIAKSDCFTLRPNPTIINPNFLIILLSSQQSLEKLTRNIHGSTRPRINTTQLKKLQIDLPSIAEQTEIVKLVEALFDWLDNVETAYTEGVSQLKVLPQSLLHKAFSGQLVSQDPIDEPASVLLERIKLARIQAEAEHKAEQQKDRQLKKTQPKMKDTDLKKTIEQVLANNSDQKLTAKQVWQQSEWQDDIEQFYAELKILMEEKRVVSEQRLNNISYLTLTAEASA